MKQRDLLFAGLLLLGAPAFAQDGPTRTPQDAKVIFFQDFEADWQKWSTDTIDVIDVLEYYNHSGNATGNSMKPWEERDKWERGLFRTDTVIALFNGVKPTDDEGEIKNQNFPSEKYETKLNNDQDRIDAMKTFGQSDLGGDYVLEYISDTCTLAAQSWGTYKGGYTANYRRNLFVRGLDIEENTSYRLTFFVKARNHKAFPVTDSYNNTPRMSAGVFRGYYQSEKPFSMGVVSDPDHNKFNTQFEYTKDDFNGQWEKVTYMTYYLTDSVANDFVFADGYWWTSWKWDADAEGNTSGDSLYYIVQPDKFFVRLGFVSDYTTFLVDNLSLTKSTIGGAEYYKDKLRIDFGYKTNMSDIVKEAKAKTNIPAAEIKYDDAAQWLKDSLNYEDRFEVWGLKGSEWEPVYIRSAEYHDDGYMYMFTDYEVNPISGDLEPLMFDDYDTVLVTFHNPIDLEDLTLKYTGTGRDLANAFPNALDTNWIKNGKIVPDFYNELATPNPYVFDGVHSMDDLPPVFQGAEIPNGSIFLTPQPSFKFKFSRDIWCETFAPGEDLRNTDKAVATVNEVPWKVEFDSDIDSLVITCPDDSWKTMNGDYVIKLIQLKGKGTEYGANVTFSYNFGTPSRTVSAEATPIDISFTMEGWSTSVAKGVYTFSENSKKTVGTGLPISTGNLNRMFVHEVEGSALLRGYEVRPHGGNNGGHVYLGAGDPDYKIHLAPGGYKFSFKGTGWSWNDADIKPATVYVFKRVDDPTKVSSDDKMEIGVYNATVKSDDGLLQDSTYAIPAENVDDVEYSFAVSEDADYIIEFNNKAGAWSQGVFVGDFQLGSVPSTVLYVNNLNDAVAAAKETVELAELDENYSGVILNALNAKIEYYDEGGAFDALLETSPDAWNNAVKELNDASTAMKLRIDTVDAFSKKVDEVLAKLSDNEVTYAECPDFIALDDIYNAALEYPVTEKVGSDIYAFNDQMTAAIKKLDDRVALNNKFANQLARADKLINDENARTDLEEYPVLVREYNAVKDAEIITNDDEAMAALYAELLDAVNGYDFKVQSIPATTKRLNALYDLAKKLDSETALNGVLKNRLDATSFDDDELAEIYKTAVKIAIYDKAAVSDTIVDSLNVTPFIKNFNLYSVASLDKVQWFEYTYGGAKNRWRLRGDINHVDDVFPGWTVRSTTSWGNSTNVHIGSESRAWNDPDAAHGGDEGAPSVFDASLSVDWNSSVTLTQSIADLPVGLYDLGINIQSGVDNSTLNATVTDPDDAEKTKTVEYKILKNSGKENQFNDSIVVSDGKMDIKFTIGSGSGWSYADDFQLIFRPLEGFDYDAAIDDLEAKLSELMTVVDARQAVKEGVEYFTIGGIKLDAPKAGQILIRKTTQSNGKVVVDKVLMK